MQLTHCQATKVPGLIGPGTVTVTSADGPGVVHVIGSGGIAGSAPVPGGGPVVVPEPGPISVHYEKAPGGPDVIDATIS